MTKNNVYPLVGIDGGMIGDGPWLLGLPAGSMIVVKDKTDHRDFTLGVFTILHKTDKSVRLCNPMLKIDTRVDPVRFCNKYDYVETLCIVDLSTVLMESPDVSDKETVDG